MDEDIVVKVNKFKHFHFYIIYCINVKQTSLQNNFMSRKQICFIPQVHLKSD